MLGDFVRLISVSIKIFRPIKYRSIDHGYTSRQIATLRGVSPNVQLYCEPWEHEDHSDVNCAVLMPLERLPTSEVGGTSVHNGESGARMCHAHCMGMAQPRSVPFVSDRPGVYGRLLLAVYVR